MATQTLATLTQATAGLDTRVSEATVPAPRIEVVERQRRGVVLGFPFDRAMGGFLLVLYDKDYNVIKRIQVPSVVEGNKIARSVGPAGVLVEWFDETTLFGDTHLFSLQGKVRERKISVSST